MRLFAVGPTSSIKAKSHCTRARVYFNEIAAGTAEDVPWVRISLPPPSTQSTWFSALNRLRVWAVHPAVLAGSSGLRGRRLPSFCSLIALFSPKVC